MGRRASKDKQILEEAWQRFEASAAEVSKLETQLAIAKATSGAHQQAYNALTQSLAPQPRQSAGTKPDGKRCTHQFEDLNGVICGGTKSNMLHDPTQSSVRYHEFTTKGPKKKSNASKDSPSRGKGQCAHEYPDNRFCGQPDTDPIHAEDNDDVFAHAFIASGARKKSSIKKQARLPTSSSEDLMDRRPAPDEMCAYISDDGRGNGAECRSVQADPIHDKSMGYGGYHPFQPSSAASSAQPLSSANGVGSSSILNSVDETASAGVAAGGSSD
jgi:hypothetical protein